MSNLIDRLPDILKDFYEYQELLKAQDPEFDLVDDILYRWSQNLHPKSADADGIAKFEDLLDITPLPGDSLEVRRFRVLTKLNARLPYTEIQLRKMLAAVCGWDGYRLTVADLTVILSLTEQNNDKIRVVYEMLREVIPMNLLIEIHQLLESYGVLYTAAATQIGTTLVILPWQAKALNNDLKIYSGALSRLGTALTLLPKQEKELNTKTKEETAGALRLGTSLTVFPQSASQIDEYLEIAAPGVVRTGVRLKIGV